MPDIEEQLKDRMEALAAAQERQGTAEEHCSMVRRRMADILREIKLKQTLSAGEHGGGEELRADQTRPAVEDERGAQCQVTLRSITPGWPIVQTMQSDTIRIFEQMLGSF